jgi:Tfp pilus assembly protein PilV
MKKYIAMSIAAAIATVSAGAETLKDVPMAKTYPVDYKETTKKSVTQTAAANTTVQTTEAAQANEALLKKVEKLEKTVKKLKKKVSKINAHDANDNIKWSADFRTAVDQLKYTTAAGKEHKNSSLLSNRLWLNMAYAPTNNMIFKGKLSFNKAYGAAPTNPVTGFPQRGYGYDTFDWVLNENLTDDKLRVKEAYWLYLSDSLLGSSVNWSASFGRRPSTDGFLISLREGDKPNSPLGHVINVEFDGASFKFGLDKATGVSGMSFKLCVGRGLTNARARFNMDGGFNALGDYTKDGTTVKDVDLAGFIFVPYDNGQYKVMTTYYRGFNVPGFVMADPGMMSGNNTGMLAINQDGSFGLNPNLSMKNMGDQDGAAISLLVDGIGDGISDFLDNTKFFASFAWSKTKPDNTYQTFDMNKMMGAIKQGVQQALQAQNLANPTQAQIEAAQAQVVQDMVQQLQANPQAAASFVKPEGMLGSNDDETGTSYWVGVNVPVMFTDDGTFGVEYNHGSKYWRPFTYAEDTMVGSKMAVRGDAIEAYYIQPLMKGFTAEIRYTKLNYDYTGSQGFFGAGGAPMSMDEARAMGMDPIEEAQDIRVSLRYKF